MNFTVWFVTAKLFDGVWCYVFELYLILPSDVDSYVPLTCCGAIKCASIEYQIRSLIHCNTDFPVRSHTFYSKYLFKQFTLFIRS
jgi:hypothetical protein